MSDIADGGTSDADFGADIPHALPPDPELVGRDAELASLRDFIQKHQATFRRLHTSVQVCITGVAGVGKSALATRLAYDLAGSYRGGALYLNLRDSQETGDLDISQVLRRFLHQLNQNPEDLPPSADLTDEYQRATNNKRLIVYLDNVTDYDSIEVLVPRTSTCLVIITSLERLADDIRSFALDGLDKKSAVELFGLIAPDRVAPGSQSDGELGKVLEACAGLPIAIRALAARLQEDRGYSFAQVLEDLATSQYTAVFGLQLDRIYSRCFGVGYDALTELQARLFRALSVVPGESFNVTTAARLAGGLPADKARADLEKLLALQLIQRTKDHNYFTMHSLLRKFGQAQLGAGVRDQLRQVLQVYCAEAKENDELIRSLRPVGGLRRPGPAGRVERISREREKALEWMGKQLRNLVAAVLAACFEQQGDAERRAGDEEHAEIAWQLCCAMVEFFEIRGEWEAWQQTHEEAEKIVERASVGYAFVTYGLGRYYGSRRQWQQAISHYRTAIAIFRAHGRDDEVGRCLNYLGDVYRYMRNWDAAQNCFTQSLEILDLTHYPRQVAVAKRSMAAIYRLRGQFRKAADLCKEAIEILENQHDERWIAATKLSLADIYLDSDDDPSSELNEPACLPLARALLEDCLEVFQIFNDTHWLILSRRSLGEALRKQGDFDGALQQLARCEESLQNTHDSQWEGQVLHSIGLVYLDQADLDAARTAFEQARDKFEAAKDTLWEGRTYVSIAHVEERDQAFGKALAHCMRAWPLLVEQGAHADLRRLEDDLTELQRQLGEAGQAPEVA